MKKIILLLAVLWGTMSTVSAQQENPRGLYKLQKFVYDNKTEKTPPFNQYKLLSDEFSMQIEHIDQDGTTAFSMINQDKHPLNYTGNVPVGEDGKGIQIFNSNKEKFTLRWYNNFMPNSALFPFDTFINEEYSKKGVAETLVGAFDIIKGNVKVKTPNKFTGVWKRRGMSDKVDGSGQLFEMPTMYKIYTDTKVMQLVGDMDNPNTLQVVGNLTPCTFYTDRLILEYHSSCLITWINDNTYSLIWISDGYPVVEIWDRAELPETLKKVFK